jgi:hypothetical protein
MKITHKIQTHNGFPPIPSTSLPHSAFSESAHYNFLPLKKNPFFHILPKKRNRRRSKTTNFQQHTPLPTYIITQRRGNQTKTKSPNKISTHKNVNGRE